MLVRLETLGDRLVTAISRPIGIALLFAVLCAGLSVSFRIPDPDLFARVAVGNLVSVRGELPHLDPFAYTPLKPIWFDHEWLSGVIFFQLVAWGGEWLLLLVKVVACGATAALATTATVTVAGKERPSFVWVMGTFYLTVAAWLSSVRSHIFTYVFLAGLILAFERYRRYGERWPLFLVPFVMIVWINCHGGFVTGLGYLGVMTLGMWVHERGRAIFPSIILLASVGACLLNPYGVDYLLFIAEAVTMPRPYVTEWYPPSFGEIEYLPFFLVLGVMLAGASLRGRSLSGDALVMLALAAIFGLRHARLVPIFGVFAVVYGWPLVQSLIARVNVRGRDLGRAFERLFALVIVAVILPTILVGVSRRFDRSVEIFDYSPYPRAALDWLWGTGATGRLLVDFDRGSFALWRLYPRFKVSLDGRYEELYPNTTIELVVAALDPRHPRHAAAFQSIEPTEILVDRDHGGYHDPAIFGTRWQTRYRDERFALLSSRELSGNSVSGSSIWEPRYRRSPGE